MKNTKKPITTAILAFLLVSAMAPLILINNVSAEGNNSSNGQYRFYRDGTWYRIETDLITILFPASGQKPMFLWWYTNDSSRVYVVKYKGLIEYMALDHEYYTQHCEANPLTVREQLIAKFATSGPHLNTIRERIMAGYAQWLLGFHPSYLPFSACRWNLTGPVEVTREDGVSYVSFNFTLEEAPPAFDFAEGNVIIRCRFYANETTENVYDLYNYTVKPNELKMDLVIKNWTWNIDKLNDFFDELQDEYDITVPEMRAGLALWTDMASIKIEELPVAEEDANSTMPEVPGNSTLAPSEPIENNSDTSDIIAEGQRIQVQNTGGNDTTPLNVRNRLHERFRLRFAEGSKTLAGFFDFVNTAVVIDPATEEKSVVNVTAAYIAAGNHLRLFIGYPYFGDKTLEHDPSIGVESSATLIPENLLLILIGTTAIITIAFVAIKLRKRTIKAVNIN